ncbi:hypothetical protein QUF72_09470 [Desulfobacterales bacterium HSG2]|nr:hypothetical protein [Desulfobacterales bacterium HSG2]
MVEAILICLILGVGAGYLVIRFYKNFKPDGVNVCGCSSSDMAGKASCGQDKIRKSGEE